MKNTYILPPRFSMDEYVNAVEFLLDSKNSAHIQKQKDMEEFIQIPFSFDQNTHNKTKTKH